MKFKLRPHPDVRLGVVVVCVSHVIVGAPRLAHAQSDARSCLAASHASIDDLDRGDLNQEYRHLSMCGDAACPSLVKEECQRRLGAITEKVALFRFDFTNAIAGESAHLAVDAKPEEPYAPGSAVALGLGHHELVFRTSARTLTVPLDVTRVGESVEQRLTWPAPLPVTTTPATAAPNQVNSDWTATKITAVALVGVGVVSLAIAGGYTLSAMHKRDRAAAACPDVCNTPADAERWAAAERAGSNATVWATVGWLGVAAGGALLAFELYTDGGEPAVQVSVAPNGLTLAGRF